MEKMRKAVLCLFFLFVFCAGGVPSRAMDKLSITRSRADEMLNKYGEKDPWEVKPDGSSLAWLEASVLRALIDLYEGTNDPGYLKEVARRGDRLLSHRDDRRGVVDGSGKSRPAWSMGLKYVVAEGALKGSSGEPVIKIVSTPSAYNDQTKIEVVKSGKGNPERFTIRASNEHFKRDEIFSDLSLDRADERFIEKVVNDPMSPYSAKPGKYSDKSNLIRVKVINNTLPANQEIVLKSVPLAYMGYIGIIYEPLLRLAEIVRSNPKLKDLEPSASRFIQAAEESYADASNRLWRNGPNSNEGYYLTCEKGESFPADNVGAPFNFQAKHVCAQLSLYRLTGKKEYLERSEKMCNLFKNRLTYNAGSDLYVWNYWYEPMTTQGWTPEDNLSANVKYFKPSASVEDISHGTLDISMIVEANRAGIVFSDNDVRRFANTLLINVLTPDRKGVRRTVDGKVDYPDYFNALHGWLELSGANPEVYKAIRQAYLANGKETLSFCAKLLKWERKLNMK
jgi:hypothetical protein